jgi:HPt (histidine-containing phosphotransfer) domain-containing protein
VSEPAIDTATFDGLVEMTGGDLAFVDELVDTYIEDGQRQVADLREAASGGEAGELVRPAHSLKSSSLNVGALVLGGLARALEEDARSGHVPDAADRVDAIAAAFGDATEGLLVERAARSS